MEEDHVDGAWGGMDEEAANWCEEEDSEAERDKLERARQLTEVLTGVRWPIYPGAWRMVSGWTPPNLATWSLMMWRLGKEKKDERNRRWVLVVEDWAKPAVHIYTQAVSQSLLYKLESNFLSYLS